MARSRTGKPSMKGKTAPMLADGQQRAVLTLFALAWRVFGFQRKQIIALSQSDPPGPMANKRGLSAELEALEQVRAEGEFAVLHDLVRAENPVHGSDQQSCSSGCPAVMITDHVPALRLPSDHAGGLLVAAVPASGDVEDRRDLDLAPPARGPAATSAAPPELELGGPGSARDSAQSDTQSAPPGAPAPGHPGHDPALAPQHPPPPLGGAVQPRQDRPAGH